MSCFNIIYHYTSLKSIDIKGLINECNSKQIENAFLNEKLKGFWRWNYSLVFVFKDQWYPLAKHPKVPLVQPLWLLVFPTSTTTSKWSWRRMAELSCLTNPCAWTFRLSKKKSQMKPVRLSASWLAIKWSVKNGNSKINK